MNDHDLDPGMFHYDAEKLNAAAGQFTREMLDNLRYDYCERKSQDWSAIRDKAVAVFIVEVALIVPNVRLADFNISWKGKTMLVIFQDHHYQIHTDEPGVVDEGHAVLLAAMIEESDLTPA